MHGCHAAEVIPGTVAVALAHGNAKTSAFDCGPHSVLVSDVVTEENRDRPDKWRLRHEGLDRRGFARSWKYQFSHAFAVLYFEAELPRNLGGKCIDLILARGVGPVMQRTAVAFRFVAKFVCLRKDAQGFDCITRQCFRAAPCQLSVSPDGVQAMRASHGDFA